MSISSVYVSQLSRENAGVWISSHRASEGMMFNHDQTTRRLQWAVHRKTDEISFRQGNLENFCLEGKLGMQ